MGSKKVLKIYRTHFSLPDHQVGTIEIEIEIGIAIERNPNEREKMRF